MSKIKVVITFKPIELEIEEGDVFPSYGDPPPSDEELDDYVRECWEDLIDESLPDIERMQFTRERKEPASGEGVSA